MTLPEAIRIARDLLGEPLVLTSDQARAVEALIAFAEKGK